MTLTICASATISNAQDSHLGVQATASIPQGDLGDKNSLDGKLGYGLGVQVQVKLKNKFAIVPRFDYTTFQRSESVTTHYPVLDLTLDTDLKATILYIGADFNYYTSGMINRGFYLLGGLGYSSGKFETSINGKAPNDVGNVINVNLSDSTTEGAFYVTAGFGFYFNQKIGTEFRYIGLNKYSKNGNDLTSPS